MNAGLPLWRRWVLAAYCHGTLPARYLRNQRNARLGRAPVMVLFYHRIADHTPNDWTLPFRQFRTHVLWLRKCFDVVGLAEAQQRIASGVNYRPAVSITFDDGYADNCAEALPLLLREKIPFTYFVSTDHVLQGKPFPHDVARGRPLRPNSLEQVQTLARAGVEIGSHTRTHADLGTIRSSTALTEEIVGSREDLSRVLDCPIDYFAFPFGRHDNLNAEAFRIAQKAGYRGVCSAYGGYNLPGDDAYHLQRIHADPDFVRLKNWLTVDPRKNRLTKRFEYQIAE